MKSTFLIKYLLNSLLFFSFVKKGNNIDSYLKWNNDYNNFIIKIFFLSRIIPSIFSYYYKKVSYVFSHISFAFLTILKLVWPIIVLFFNIIVFSSKFAILFFVYFIPIFYAYLKNNFLSFIQIVKKRKLFFINNLYNSFSSKILLSGTAFFSIYILVFVLLLMIIIPFFVLKQQEIIINNLGEKIYFNNLVLTQISFLSCLILCFVLFVLLNIIHSFLAFLSLCYDYLLKKLNSENFFVLFIISSTTLQIFFKLLSLIFIL